MRDSSTKEAVGRNAPPDPAVALVEGDWEEVMPFLPPDLDATARATKALVRRREVRCAADLLRIALAYAVCDWSLRLVGAWCLLVGLGDLSDVAVLNRLRQSVTWLGTLTVQLLQQRRLSLSRQEGVRLRLVDATTISRPGSQGTDWRVHLSLDLGRLCLDGIAVTDAHGGESLARFPGQAQEIVVADRGYAFANSLGPVLAAESWLVVRINWQNLPLQDGEGRRLDLIAWLQTTFVQGACEPQETPVWLSTPQGRFPLRLIAGPLCQEAADRARQRAHQAARKKGRTPAARTLWACGFVLVVSNLPPAQWSAQQVLALYRLRWQIEMVCKRLKGLLHLDGLRAQDPRLAQAYLLGKLLGALFLDALTNTTAQLQPEWFGSLERPVSPWRLMALLGEQLRNLVAGHILWGRVVALLPRLRRFLCDSPRKRRQQLAQARSLLVHLSVC